MHGNARIGIENAGHHFNALRATLKPRPSSGTAYNNITASGLLVLPL